MGSVNFDDLPDDRHQAPSFDALPDDRAPVPVRAPESTPAPVQQRTIPELLLDKVKQLGQGIAVRAKDLTTSDGWGAAARGADVTGLGFRTHVAASKGLAEATNLGHSLERLVGMDAAPDYDPELIARHDAQDMRAQLAQDANDHPGKATVGALVPGAAAFGLMGPVGLGGTMLAAGSLGTVKSYNEHPDEGLVDRSLEALGSGAQDATIAGILHVPISGAAKVGGALLRSATRSAGDELSGQVAGDLNTANAQKLAELRAKIAEARGQQASEFNASEDARVAAAQRNQKLAEMDLGTQRDAHELAAAKLEALKQRRILEYVRQQQMVDDALKEHRVNFDDMRQTEAAAEGVLAQRAQKFASDATSTPDTIEEMRPPSDSDVLAAQKVGSEANAESDADRETVFKVLEDIEREKTAARPSSSSPDRAAEIQAEIDKLPEWEKQKYAAEVGALMGRAGNLKAIGRMSPEFEQRFGDIFDRHSEITQGMLEKDPAQVASEARAAKLAELQQKLEMLRSPAPAAPQAPGTVKIKTVIPEEALPTQKMPKSAAPSAEPPKTIKTRKTELPTPAPEAPNEPTPYEPPSRAEMLAQLEAEGKIPRIKVDRSAIGKKPMSVSALVEDDPRKPLGLLEPGKPAALVGRNGAEKFGKNVADVAKEKGLDIDATRRPFRAPSVRSQVETEAAKQGLRLRGQPLSESEIAAEAERRVAGAKPGLSAGVSLAQKTYGKFPGTKWLESIEKAKPEEVVALARKLGSAGNALLSAYSRGTGALTATLHVLGKNPEVAKRLNQLLGAEAAPSARAP